MSRFLLPHSNEETLTEPDAMLFIKGIRTLLHYMDAKMESS